MYHTDTTVLRISEVVEIADIVGLLMFFFTVEEFKKITTVFNTSKHQVYRNSMQHTGKLVFLFLIPPRNAHKCLLQ